MKIDILGFFKTLIRTCYCKNPITAEQQSCAGNKRVYASICSFIYLFILINSYKSTHTHLWILSSNGNPWDRNKIKHFLENLKECNNIEATERVVTA